MLSAEVGRGLGGTADQRVKDRAHLGVGDGLLAEVEGGEPSDHHWQEAGLGELRGDGVQVELGQQVG